MEKTIAEIMYDAFTWAAKWSEKVEVSPMRSQLDMMDSIEKAVEDGHISRADLLEAHDKTASDSDEKLKWVVLLSRIRKIVENKPWMTDFSKQSVQAC